MADQTPLPEGFRAAGAACGIKKTGAPDLALVVADGAWPAAAVFTQCELRGAHIPVCRRHLSASGHRVRALLVNSGNANCAVGPDGEQHNEEVCAALGELLGCPKEQVLFLSTGVIGARLPIDKIRSALPGLCEKLDPSGIDAFARAIMTTDTRPKLASSGLTATGGEPVRITGVAKGAGMIHPDMATMFGFLLTDGRTTGSLQLGLAALCNESFHRVTIDGDTSPNDTVVLWTADRHACRPERDEHGIERLPLERELTRVAVDLSRQIAADGEGATRLVTVEVRGATSDRDVIDTGRFIGTSPLVKTAIYGRDPNWGRILSAAGNAGVAIDVARARVWIGEHVMFAEGRAWPENEKAASAYLRENEEVRIGVDLAMGPFAGETWTCDYSPAYVTINADYRS